MTGIKFDEEKVKKCIEAYHDMNDEYPYLVCSEETRKILPPEKKDNYFTITADKIIASDIMCLSSKYQLETITVNDKKFVLDEFAPKDYGTWYGAKILVDNKLEFGEVHVG